MRHLEVNGTTVSYTTKGSGKGLVLLHGTHADGASAFGQLSPRFSDRRTVVVPDYAGCGASTVPEGELSLDLLVEQVAAVVGSATAQPVDLVGVSLGAVVAAAVAARHPGLVRRLVLVAGWVDGTDSRHQLVCETWRRLAAADPELGVRFALSVAFSPPYLSALGTDKLSSLISRAAPDGIGHRIGLCLRADLRDHLSGISAPTLVVGLRHDHLIPVESSRRLHRLIAGSSYAEIDSGHVVTLERPDAFVSQVRDFLFSGADSAASEGADAVSTDGASGG